MGVSRPHDAARLINSTGRVAGDLPKSRRAHRGPIVSRPDDIVPQFGRLLDFEELLDHGLFDLETPAAEHAIRLGSNDIPPAETHETIRS